MRPGYLAPLAALALVVLAPGCGQEEGQPRRQAQLLQPAPEQINILLITIDTLRGDYLGCYGQEEVSTPVIDRLATEGALFSFCVAHNPLTLPSHANILTGTDARTHGVHDNSGFRLPPEAVTLAEVLGEAGYDTAAFVGAFVLDSRFGLEQGFDLYDDYISSAGTPDLLQAERPADEVVEPALRWLAERGEEPWFAWVHVYDPHVPRHVPAPLSETYADNLYAGEVSYVDYAFRELFDHLRESGRLDSTLVVLTSDHGEGLGDHGERTHGTFAYNTTLWVPLIIRAPWRIAPGTVVDRRVRHIDLLPTILEFVDVPVPEAAEGESLLGLLAGEGEGEPAPAPDSYFEALTAMLNRGWAPLRGVFHQQWKFIDLPIPELYDMSRDFDEDSNLFERRAGTANRLRTILRGLTESEEAGLSVRRREDSETRRRLQALGYLAGSPQPEREHYGPEDDPKRLIGLGARLDECAVATAARQWERAEEILLAIIAERPQMTITYQILASVLTQAGRPDEALAVLEQATEMGAGGQTCFFQLASTLMQVNQYERAVAILEELHRRHPDDLNAAHLLANGLSRQGEARRAERLYNEVLGADPTFVDARCDFGWHLLRENRFDEGRAQFDNALQYDQEHAPSHHGLGLIHERNQRWREAIDSYCQALEAEPDRHGARLRLGMVLARLRRFDEATAELRRFLAETDESSEAEDRARALRVLDLIRRSGN